MKRSILVIVCVLLMTSLAYADKAAIFSTGDGAIRGYDPVAYFTDGKAVKGKQAFKLVWRGATWQFASADHRDRFQANPAKYAPQFGGYCSYAVANGYTASTDPAAWTIVDGKLYLNYSLSVRKKWLRDTAGYIARANNNWPDVLKQ